MRKQSEAQTDEQGEITRTAHLDRQKSNGIYRYRKASIRRMGQWIHQCLVCHSLPHVLSFLSGHSRYLCVCQYVFVADGRFCLELFALRYVLYP